MQGCLEADNAAACLGTSARTCLEGLQAWAGGLGAPQKQNREGWVIEGSGKPLTLVMVRGWETPHIHKGLWVGFKRALRERWA